MTTWAEFFGTVGTYPPESDVRLGREYGPNDDDMVGELQVTSEDSASTEIIELIRGDSYDDVAHPKVDWVVDKDFAGWTGLLTIRHRITGATLLSKAVVVVSATEIEATLTTTDTAFTALVALSEFGPHPYDVQMTIGSNGSTPIRGIAIIWRDRTY